MKNFLSIVVALALLTAPAVAAAQDARSMQAARAVSIALILVNAEEEEEALVQCNLNEDSAKEINAAIPEISMELAERIVSYRTNNGNFRGVLDLLAVPGLDSEIVRRNRHLIIL